MIALIVVDMIKGNLPFFNEDQLAIIPRIKRVAEEVRRSGNLVVYANDSYTEKDWLFRFMKRHAIRGTNEVEVLDELKPESGDIVLEKKRFSAFFRTDLDLILREYGVEKVAIAGVNTHVCVLATALDAVSNNFEAVILKDCCASNKRELHEFVVNKYKLIGLDVKTSEEFLREISEGF